MLGADAIGESKMAIRFQKGRSSPFIVYYRNPFTGRQESIACKTREDAERQDDLVKFRLKHEKESFRRLPENAVKKEGNSDDSLEAIAYAYLKEKRFPERMLRNYVSGLMPALEQIGRKSISAITKDDLAFVMLRYADKGIKPTSLRQYMQRIMTIFRWAEKRGLVDHVPKAPELPQGTYEHFMPPTPEEISALLQVVPQHVQRAIVIGCKFGLRVGPCELFKLRWDDVLFDRGVIRVNAAAKNHNEPWREVPIKDSVMPILQLWHDEDAKKGIEHVISYRGKPVKAITAAWRMALKKVGIARHIRPYDLRHAFATDAIAAGVDVGTVSKLMGHSNPVMVLKHYQHVMTQQKKAAVEALPDVSLYVQGLYVQKESGFMQ